MSISLRHLASSLLLATAIASSSAACAVDGPGAEDCRAPIDVWLQAKEVAGVDGLVVELSIPGDVPVILDGGVCACATADCRDAYVEEHLGCGVCVTFDCDGDKVGGCAPCDGAPTPGKDLGDGTARPPAAELDRADLPLSASTGSADLARPIDLSGLGEECDKGFTCGAGLACIGGGISPHEQRSTCEIGCPAGDKQCPIGTTCATISDGPGRVCRPISG